MVGPMGPRTALAWLLTLLLCSLAAVLVYTALEPPPPEVRPIKVDRDGPAGGHGEDSGEDSGARTRHPGRGPATEPGRAAKAPSPTPMTAGTVGVASRISMTTGPSATDPDEDAGGGGRAADPGDAPEHVIDRDGWAHQDDPPDNGGGDGE